MEDMKDIKEGNLIFVGEKGKNLRGIFCPVCNSKQYHKILSHELVLTEEIIEEEPDDYDYTLETQIARGIEYKLFFYSQVIVCKGCKSASLRNVTVRENESNADNEEIIPLRIDRGISTKFNYEIIRSERILKLYKEAVVAYNHKLNFSASAAIRSLIESICKHRGHKETVINQLKNGLLRKKRKLNLENLSNIELTNFLQEVYNSGEHLAKNFRELKNKYCNLETGDINLTEKEEESLEIKANLKKQIKELKKDLRSKTLVSDSKLEILDKIVEWGNSNIHGVGFPLSEEISSAIDIIEFIFHAIYINEHEEGKFDNSENRFNESYKSRR